MSKMPLTAAGSYQKKPAPDSKGWLRPLCKALLVGEGGASRSEATGEGFSPRRKTPHPARFARHLLPQGEKEEEPSASI
jgi:hypothetical protein